MFKYQKVIATMLLAALLALNTAAIASSPHFGGDTQITSVIPGTGASQLGKAEDAAHASGDAGVSVFCVLKAGATASAGTAADYATLLCDSTTGALYTDVQKVTPGTAASNLGKAEDAAHTSADVGVMGLGVQGTNVSALGAAGDYVPQQFNANGQQFVTQLKDDAPVVLYDATVTATGDTDAGANLIYSVTYCNADATDRHYLKIYDKATAADENDTPIIKIGADGLECETVNFLPFGVPIANGISKRAVAENVDSGTTAASANESSTVILADD